MNRKPLGERLARVAQGRMSDPAANAVFMRARTRKTASGIGIRHFREFSQALGLEGIDVLDMPDGEIAARIHEMWHSPERHEDAVHAIRMLGKPYLRKYRRKKNDAQM